MYFFILSEEVLNLHGKQNHFYKIITYLVNGCNWFICFLLCLDVNGLMIFPLLSYSSWPIALLLEGWEITAVSTVDAKPLPLDRVGVGFVYGWVAELIAERKHVIGTDDQQFNKV